MLQGQHLHLIVILLISQIYKHPLLYPEEDVKDFCKPNSQIKYSRFRSLLLGRISFLM
jgi:hypothetical protein